MSRVRADQYTNNAGTGSPLFPNGLRVTGVSTFSGNVSIGGTLTYEDVTNVDSVGIITAQSDVVIADKIIHLGDTDTAIRFPANDTFTVETGGSEITRVDSTGFGIFTNSPSQALTLRGEQLIETNSTSADSGNGIYWQSTTGGWNTGQAHAAIFGKRVDASNGYLRFDVRQSGTTSEKLRITSTGGFHFTNGELIERAKVTAGKLSDNTDIDLENGMVHLFTTQETTTSTPNIRINSSTSLNSVMAIGEMISVTLITTAATGAYSAQLTIDGGAVTENWTGGSAPSDGGSSGVDIHAYTIIKTADATFTVIATQTKTS